MNNTNNARREDSIAKKKSSRPRKRVSTKLSPTKATVDKKGIHLKIDSGHEYLITPEVFRDAYLKFCCAGMKRDNTPKETSTVIQNAQQTLQTLRFTGTVQVTGSIVIGSVSIVEASGIMKFLDALGETNGVIINIEEALYDNYGNRPTHTFKFRGMIDCNCLTIDIPNVSPTEKVGILKFLDEIDTDESSDTQAYVDIWALMDLNIEHRMFL